MKLYDPTYQPRIGKLYFGVFVNKAFKVEVKKKSKAAGKGYV